MYTVYGWWQQGKKKNPKPGLNVLPLVFEIKLISSVFLIGVTETVGQFTNTHEMGWACIADESIALSDGFHLPANRIKTVF